MVLGWKDGTGTIGIQTTGCDPHFKVIAVPATEDLVALVPEALEEAQARWSEAEQNPTYNLPVVQVTQPAAEPATRRTGREAPSGPQRQPLL